MVIRVRAIFRKELREYRHTGSIIATMAVIPLVFISFPLIAVLRLPASESRALLEGHPLAILLASRHSQLGAVASAPPIAVTYLVALDVIHATLGLALGFVAALLVFDGLGWRAVSSMFDRERLVTGTRS